MRPRLTCNVEFLSLLWRPESLAKGPHQVEARLGEGGSLRLSVDGKIEAYGRAPGLIAGQPADGLTVGENGSSPVGEYETPNALAGKVRNVVVRVL
jgi:hypothetical protein